MAPLFAQEFGARVQQLRKAAGFQSTHDLADAVSNPRVTAAIIKNIETGRKTDVSVVHLLELSMAIGVSPLMLLFDYSNPDAELDAETFGLNFHGVSMMNLDYWAIVPLSDPWWPVGLYSEGSATEVRRVATTRKIIIARRERDTWRDDTRSLGTSKVPRGFFDDLPLRRKLGARAQAELNLAASEAAQLGMTLDGNLS